ERPKSNAPAQWVQPRLVCEVSFTGWTEDGHMRHPVFMGLREDKPASEVRREVLPDVSEIDSNQSAAAPRPRKRKAAAKTDWSVQPSRKMSIAGRVVPLTNLNKLYWPTDGIMKGDLIQY